MSALTRRGVLVAAAGAPFAAASAAWGAEPQVSGDAGVVRPLRRAELAAEATYKAVAAAAVSPGVTALAGRFRGHERAHAMAMSTAMEALGARLTPPPADAAELDAELRALGLAPFSAVHGDDAQLAYLLALEERLIGHWIGALRTLRDPGLRQTAGQILACQGQHAVVLRTALNRQSLPKALDIGA